MNVKARALYLPASSLLEADSSQPPKPLSPHQRWICLPYYRWGLADTELPTNSMPRSAPAIARRLNSPLPEHRQYEYLLSAIRSVSLRTVSCPGTKLPHNEELNMEEPKIMFRLNISHNRLLALTLLMLASGCKAQPPMLLSPSVTGYNHTSAAINWFTVNGDGGPNLGPQQGGGGFICCTTVPRQWQPGMTATVEWEKDPEPFAYANWAPLGTEEYRAAYKLHAAKYTHHRVTVEIPPYEKIGSMKVHFLPCDGVRVAVNNVQPNYPGYPHNDVINMEEPTECPKP